VKKTVHSDSGLAWLLLILLSLIWGSSFILIKKALISFNATQVGAARIAISFLAFLPLFIKHFKSIPWNKLKPFIIVGLCGSGFPAFLFAIGQQEIPSSAAGVFNSLTPIFTFIIAIFFFKARLYGKQLTGVILGFSGASLLFLAKQEGELAFPFFHSMLMVLATISYGISANTVNRFLVGVKPTVISVVSFVIIGPFMLIYLLNSSFLGQLKSHPQAMGSFAALLVLSLVGTFLANILFFKLIQLTDAVFSSSVSFIIPIVALLWGVLDGEMISVYHLAALGLILSGVFLIKRMR